MRKTSFEIFGRTQTGRIVTSSGNHEVVFSRNPYGSHNLLLIDRDNDEPFCFGNKGVLYCLLSMGMDKAYRRARRFLANRGRCLDLVFYNCCASCGGSDYMPEGAVICTRCEEDIC